MRIVGGEARGRRLLSVPGDATRPTADRVRQSLFDVLGQRCDGLLVLDLYAGTGALALEALSRGAERAVLVEQANEAARVIEQNAAALGFGGRVRLVKADVSKALRDLSNRGERFDLIFSDPPYALQAAQRTVEAVGALLLLRPGGRLLLERDRREPAPAAVRGLALSDQRTYGDTAVDLFSAEG